MRCNKIFSYRPSLRRRICIVLAVLWMSNSPLIVAQDIANWGVRVGYSPFTEDKWGLGASYRSANKHWFHQLELYLLQNRKSSINHDARNLGFLWRSNYIINLPINRFHWTVGGEVYAYRYTRYIASLMRDDVAQISGVTGIDVRIGKNIHLNAVLPLLGGEMVRSKDSIGDSFHFMPYFVGFYGFFQPKIGIEVGLF